MEETNDNSHNKRGRDEAELEIYSPEVKRLRENLLESFDDETETEFCSENHDLDSFMKSFEVEITSSPTAVAAGEAADLVDLTSDSGESRPDLGYLFEASDDELGLPPTVTSSSSSGDAATELVRVESDTSDLGSEFWEAPGYDSFELGFGGGNDEYVALDGLFDYSDMGFGAGEFGYIPETLPAQ